MVFSGLTFLLLFLPVFYLLYFSRTADRWRNGVLVAASLVFYAWGEPVWICAMLLSVGVNYVCALRIVTAKPAARKLWLVLGVVASLAFLLYFKYSAFFINSVCALAGLDYRMAAPKLPVGISFYTFQILTYTVDVYRGKSKELRSPFQLLLYISCFPQLIAGPIVQYSDIADSLAHRDILPDDFICGFRRFIIGLGKKVLIANLCGAGLEALPQAGTGTALSLLGAWLGAFLYTMQIYYDFSAYSDMAIGLGQTMGFRYKENFDHPYCSASVTEFWRRWHMSLGSFFRDYVYIPLGGSRRGTGRTILNLLIVWALTGLWHGASWNFVLWGSYYGLLLILEKFLLRPVLDRTPTALRRVLTFLLAMFGWVIFYYTDLSAVLQHLAAMFGIGTGGALTDAASIAVLRRYTVFPLCALLLSLPVVPALRTRLFKGSEPGMCLPAGADFLYSVFCAALLVLCVLFLVGQSYNPFIYFRF